jgi:hypothetical protein
MRHRASLVLAAVAAAAGVPRAHANGTPSPVTAPPATDWSSAVESPLTLVVLGLLVGAVVVGLIWISRR